MAKFAAYVVLAAVVFVAHAASASRTTITTIVTDDDSRPGQQCRQQIQQRDLSQCKQYLREQQHGGRGYDEGRAELITSDTDSFERCCNELRMIRDEQCRCEGLQQEMQQGDMGQQETSKMLQSAQRLPSMCGVGPNECNFGRGPYY